MSSKKPVVLVIRDGWGRNPLGPDVAKEYGDATVLAFRTARWVIPK